MDETRSYRWIAILIAVLVALFFILSIFVTVPAGRSAIEFSVL